MVQHHVSRLRPSADLCPTRCPQPRTPHRHPLRPHLQRPSGAALTPLRDQLFAPGPLPEKLLLAGCSTSQQHASVSQERFWSDSVSQERFCSVYLRSDSAPTVYLRSDSAQCISGAILLSVSQERFCSDSVSQERFCSDSCTCCHAEIEVADQTFYLTHSTVTRGQPVPALALSRQALGRVANGVPVFQSLV